jgi:RNase P subunit RPR2
MKTAPLAIEPQTLLTCPFCGNTNRFVEVMAEEAHLVNGRRDYIRLVAAVTDHFMCCECGETFEHDDFK